MNGDMELKNVFISTGEKFGFYTLRGTYLVKICWKGETRIIQKDYFFRNLSTDKAKAETLAQEYAEHYGVPFVGNADFTLEEIQRRKSEEVQEQKERVERLVREAEERAKEEYARVVQEGVFVTGKYLGMTPSEVDVVNRKYLFWAAEQFIEGLHANKFNVNCALAKKYIEENNIQPSDFVGVEGEQIELTLTLREAYWTRGQFPSIQFLCFDENGNDVCFFSTAKGFKALKNGEKFSIRGLVKQHYTNWKGEKSTTINKPKMI